MNMPGQKSQTTMTDLDIERLHRKQNLVTTLVLILVFVELARILTTLNWDLIYTSAVAIFLIAIAWLLAHFSS